jgi:hypothetical protein
LTTSRSLSNDGLIDHQRRHPLGLGEDQPFQVLGRNGLEVAGDIVGR